VWIAFLSVMLGSAIGGAARYALSGVVANWIGATFPWGTLIVNVTGCFVIGIFDTVTGPDGGVLVPANIRILVMAGVCGGYTTFSSFGLETVNLVRNGEWFAAEAYILASVVFCLIAVWLGHFAGVLINR
jgi:fluoride exporter